MADLEEIKFEAKSDGVYISGGWDGWLERAKIADSVIGVDGPLVNHAGKERLVFTPVNGYAEYDVVDHDDAAKTSTIERRLRLR